LLGPFLAPTSAGPQATLPADLIADGGSTMRNAPERLTMTLRHIAPIVLLFGSNIFMTFAWYGHLRFADRALWVVVLASWGIAFFEYWLAVPANRIGHQVYSAAELKVMQEVITLAVFAGFSALYLREPLTINHAIGFALIVAGAFFVFKSPIGS
jgi:uncharacterized protein (DUF486 family)